MVVQDLPPLVTLPPRHLDLQRQIILSTRHLNGFQFYSCWFAYIPATKIQVMRRLFSLKIGQNCDRQPPPGQGRQETPWMSLRTIPLTERGFPLSHGQYREQGGCSQLGSHGLKSLDSGNRGSMQIKMFLEWRMSAYLTISRIDVSHDYRKQSRRSRNILTGARLSGGSPEICYSPAGDGSSRYAISIEASRVFLCSRRKERSMTVGAVSPIHFLLVLDGMLMRPASPSFGDFASWQWNSLRDLSKRWMMTARVKEVSCGFRTSCYASLKRLQST